MCVMKCKGCYGARGNVGKAPGILIFGTKSKTADSLMLPSLHPQSKQALVAYGHNNN
jgi:hypothetical protein